MNGHGNAPRAVIQRQEAQLTFHCARSALVRLAGFEAIAAGRAEGHSAPAGPFECFCPVCE
jgi:hypothetical protein